MGHQAQNWVKVAELNEVSEGKPKAVQMGEGRSIALFNVDGKIYTTDNQYPQKCWKRFRRPNCTPFRSR